MTLRQTNVARLAAEEFDVCIVGGGINGAVSAAALAGCGVRVALVDRGDFAGETSQESSNLAWGGIKYLESFDFALVRDLCRARNELIRAYPSTVREIGFYMSHPRGFRWPLWFVWLGAWLYWFMGSCFTRRPRLLSRRRMQKEEPVIETSLATGGVEYSDAFLHDNDARFVWNFVRSALDRGCVAANYVEVLSAERHGEGRTLEVRDVVTGRTFAIRTRLVVNAAGPFVEQLNERLGVRTEHRHVLSKGIHVLVPRITPSQRVLTFFADDGRLFFVIPMGPRTCIGTTDTRVDGPDVLVTEEDRRFVLDNINKRLRLPAPLTEADVIAERCGVRPLVVKGGARPGGGDWLQLSRKHEVEVTDGVVCIFGGKLTDCLNVGEEILEHVAAAGIPVPHRGYHWYGEPGPDVREEFFHQARLMRLDELTSPSAAEKLSTRLWRRYGAHALTMLEEIRRDPRNAEPIIEHAEYIRCEIQQAAQREMIVKLEDFLRRRSKIALVVRREDVHAAEGVQEACHILFGEDAPRRIAEYFAERDRRSVPARAPDAEEARAPAGRPAPAVLAS